jgi:hypothetical protein
MPAQSQAGQIDVPIFRMLGSDPIYQFGNSPGMHTLEPVYPRAGGSADWVAWFLDNLIHQPSLAFGYAQAGQENSFGWEAMKTGLTMQVVLLAAQAKAGEIQVMTLQEAGKWFHKKYPVTPPTSVVCLTDWEHENRKTVWYDSRFYRINFLWQNDSFFIRDLHRFDEKAVSVTHDAALTNSYLAYETLPVMDGALWSGTRRAGIWPVLLSPDGRSAPMEPDRPPEVRELNATDLSISQSLRGGGTFSIVCRESDVSFTGVDGRGQPLHWAWDFIGGPQLRSIVQSVAPQSVAFQSAGLAYSIRLASDAGTCEQLDDGVIRLSPNGSGKLILLLAEF